MRDHPVYLMNAEQRQVSANPQTKLEIVLERVLVLFRSGTMSLRSGLGTSFVLEPDHAKHYR